MMIFNVNPYAVSDEDYALMQFHADEASNGSFDLSDDAEALASIGWGTDEDYYAGGEDSYIDSYWESLYEMD